MAPSFHVEAGGRCFRPGDLDEISVREVFRVAAPGPAAAEVVALQLLHAAAGRQRRVVREAWARTHAGPPA
jgi:hypothetical protein